jgi:hypothetical protein
MITSYLARINFTKEWFDGDVSTEYWDDAECQFFSMEGPKVQTVCLNHQCWLEFWLPDTDEKQNEEIVRDMIGRIHNIIDKLSSAS